MRVLLVYVGVIMRWDIRRKEKKKNTEEDFSITFSPFCRFGAVRVLEVELYSRVH